MSCKVHITNAAEQDIAGALDYIEFELRNPTAADALFDRINAEIESLSEFSQRYSVVQDPVLRTWGIRFIKINNYLAFYTFSQSDETVYIVRFLYAKRNWAAVLRAGVDLT